MVGAAELDMAFASGALSAWADTSMTAPEEVCDRMFEGARHAIIDFEAALSPRDRGLLRPLLDLLTGLKLSESKPVATAVLGPGMHGVFSAIEWGQANPTELEIIKTALPRLQALARPLGPFDLAVVRLIELTVECQDLAPVLFEHGVREVRDIMANAAALLVSGVESWKLEAIIRGRLETTLALAPGRPDHPVAEVRQKASWAAALEAALPQNRQALDSRLKSWRELSAAWEKPPFPVNAELVRCIGASLRAGGYHSCSLYFSAATSHQLRTLALPIGEQTRFIIRDTVRAIKRGLGPTKLKDSFDFEVLRALVRLEEALRAFDERDMAAAVDLQEPLCPYHCAKGTWRGCGWLASRPQQRTLLRLPQNIRAATALGSLPASSTSPPTAVMILRDEEPATPPARRRRRGRADPAPDGPPPLLDESSLAAPLTGITMDQVRAEIAKAIPPVRENLIVQPRRRVAHEIGVPEAQNEVHRWRTTCGWGYGGLPFIQLFLEQQFLGVL
ncbi:DNMT3B [Symbiodinium pilosum]|uniref:DNMT3B protein n=1 Tax=Symbiodinium pilosum TaxID=2952 RepID=A0A812LTE6_SYMPI|nr:DNMT3B [Symbiodinium pilosum]